MRGWILVSLILNAILLWRCWDARAKATTSLELGNAPTTLQISVTKGAPPLSNQVPPTISEPEGNEPGFRWAEVESEDLAEFRDRLRAKGCPETLERDNKLPQMKAGLVGKLGGLKMDDNAMDHFLADFVAQAKIAIPAHHTPGLTPEQRDRLEQQTVQNIHQSMQRHFLK